MAQPTQVLDWIPDNTSNINDPVSLKAYGYTLDAWPLSSNHNWIFNVVSQWLDYYKAIDDKVLRSDLTLIVGTTFQVLTAQTVIDGIDEIANGVTLTIEITAAAVSGSLNFYNFKNPLGTIKIQSDTAVTDYLTSSNTIYDFQNVECAVTIDQTWIVCTGNVAALSLVNCTGIVSVSSFNVDINTGDGLSIIGCSNVFLSSPDINSSGSSNYAICVADNSLVMCDNLGVSGTIFYDWCIIRNSTVTDNNPGTTIASSTIDDGGAYRYYTGGVWTQIYNSF